MNNGYVEILKCRTIINSTKFISGTRTQTMRRHRNSGIKNRPKISNSQLHAQDK